MGLTESKLNTQITKTLVEKESGLPSFSLDTAKFSDGTSGFIITTIDLAKNSSIKTIPIKFVYSPSENTVVFVGTDNTVLSFSRDRYSGKVVCSITSLAKEMHICLCVSTYEYIDDAVIDKIGELYSKQQQSSS